jgi:hypothetical protein
MVGLGSELRRLGYAQGRASSEMAKAIRDERKVVKAPKAKPIARKVVVTTTAAEEKALRDNLAIIAEAFRNGIISEAKARSLVARL